MPRLRLERGRQAAVIASSRAPSVLCRSSRRRIEYDYLYHVGRVPGESTLEVGVSELLEGSITGPRFCVKTTRRWPMSRGILDCVVALIH